MRLISDTTYCSHKATFNLSYFLLFYYSGAQASLHASQVLLSQTLPQLIKLLNQYQQDVANVYKKKIITAVETRVICKTTFPEQQEPEKKFTNSFVNKMSQKYSNLHLYYVLSLFFFSPSVSFFSPLLFFLSDNTSVKPTLRPE